MITETESSLSKYIKALDNVNPQTALPIPDQPFVWGVFGPRGSGKSTLVYGLLQSPLWKGKWDNIYLCSQTWESDSFTKKPLKDLCDELIAEGKLFDSFTPEDAEEIREELEAYNARTRAKYPKKKIRNLLILDDVLTNLPFRKASHPGNKLIVNGRHMKLTTVYLLQKISNAAPPLWRDNTQIWSFFKVSNKKAKNFIIDIVEGDPDKVEDILDYATSKPNSFLHISLMNGGKPIFFRNFNQLSVKD